MNDILSHKTFPRANTLTPVQSFPAQTLREVLKNLFLRARYIQYGYQYPRPKEKVRTMTTLKNCIPSRVIVRRSSTQTHARLPTHIHPRLYPEYLNLSRKKIFHPLDARCSIRTPRARLWSPLSVTVTSYLSPLIFHPNAGLFTRALVPDIETRVK